MPATIDVTKVQKIPAPPEAVFDYIADMRNDPEWVPAVPKVEQIEGDGPGEGARYASLQMLEDGSQLTNEYTLTEYDRANALAWEVDNDFFGYKATMKFEPDGDGTIVTQRNVTVLKPVPKENEAHVNEGAAANMAQQMANLVKHFEGAD